MIKKLPAPLKSLFKPQYKCTKAKSKIILGPVYLLLVTCYLLLATPALANKCGVNIGPMRQNVGRVKDLTKEGGWVVALGTPGDCTSLEALFGQGLNVVIRAFNGGKKFTNEQALGWVATLGKIDTKGQIIYFMPWNEPNHDLECGNSPCTPTEIADYINFLKSQLAAAGLSDKVVLLSPMIDKLNPRFEEFKSVYSLTSGSSINEYDQFVNGPCSGAATQNNCLYNQIGIPGPYYALESGVAGTCSPPCYRDNELIQMLNTSWAKWNTDGAFKMFAIFSYDPHRPGAWDIFSAPQVKNFYTNNCQSGGVESGSINQTLFGNWLSKQSLVACDGCGYASSQNYCSATGAGTSNEPEVINPQNSLVCQNLDIEYRKSESETITNTPTPTINLANTLGTRQETGDRVFSGEFLLEKMDFPDFSKMEELLRKSLDKLLPSDLNQLVSIESQPLTSRIKHFITGVYPTGTPQPTPQPPIPETEFNQPGWFTQLLGVTKIICGLFNVCPAPQSLTIKVNQPNINALSTSINSNAAFCPQSYSTTGESTNPKPTQANYQTTAYYERTIETNQTPNGVTTNINEKADLLDKTRGWLVGGETLNQQYPFLYVFLPAELISEDSFALKNQADYTITPDSLQIKNEEAVNYQNLAAVRAFCLQQCSLLPSGTDINSIYSFCLSCNPKDYPLVSLDTAFCTKDGGGICNYCTTDHSYEGCGPNLDPFCEGGLCCPYQYGQAKDYKDHKCEVPYANIAPDCFDKAVCHLVRYAKNPSGGYGACHYSSPEVCVRTDREAVGYCAATCNYVCCQ